TPSAQQTPPVIDGNPDEPCSKDGRPALLSFAPLPGKAVQFRPTEKLQVQSSGPARVAHANFLALKTKDLRRSYLRIAPASAASRRADEDRGLETCQVICVGLKVPATHRPNRRPRIGICQLRVSKVR